LTGSSSWSAPRGMIIGVRPSYAGARPARRPAPRRARRRRGGSCRPTGSSTSTWRTPSRAPPAPAGCGQSRLGAALDAGHAGHRQARRVDAVEPAGDQRIARLHVGVARQEAQLHRAAPASRAPPKAALRCWVRALSTGIAASGRPAA
jgi:hypothetical protein